MAKHNKRGRAVPKALLGALISTGVSAVTGMIASDRAKKEADKKRRTGIAVQKGNERLEDINELQDFDTEGQGAVDYYKNGGKIDPPAKKGNPHTPRSTAYRRYETTARNKSARTVKGAGIGAKRANPKGRKVTSGSVNSYGKGGRINPNSTYSTTGGKLVPISKDMNLAVGNKHGETKIDGTSGIKLKKGGKAIVEVEGGEPIKNDKMVYSDRLSPDGGKTYAGKAVDLATKKHAAKGNRARVNQLDKAENALFAKQENSKKGGKKDGRAIPKAGFGDFIGKAFSKKNLKGTAESLIPAIDNIGNAIINANTPKIQGPSLTRRKAGKTTVNVNPQLAETQRAVNDVAGNVQQNTSNSAVARSNIASARLKGANQKGRILAGKENAETALINAENDKQARVNASNADKVDRNNMQQTQRADAVGARTSANLANLAGDFIDKKNFDSKEAYNKDRVDIAKQMYNKGTTARADALLASPAEQAEEEERLRKMRGGIRGGNRKFRARGSNQNLGTRLT